MEAGRLNWAMFLDDAVPRHQRDHGSRTTQDVCRNVVPSWADKKNVVDD